jgi:hypothetical protein
MRQVPASGNFANVTSNLNLEIVGCAALTTGLRQRDPDSFPSRHRWAID